MKITTFSANRKNPFVWLASCLCLASIACRIVYFAGIALSFWNSIFEIWLPILACLLIAERLPHRGKEMYYVTVWPVFMLAFSTVWDAYYLFGSHKLIFIWILGTCAIIAFVYFLTFAGYVPTKYVSLVSLILPFILGYGFKILKYYIFSTWPYMHTHWLSVLFYWLAVICAVISCKKMPEKAEGEIPYKRFGDKVDGRLVRNLKTQEILAPFFMQYREDASNYIADSVDATAIEKYIHKMRKEGYKHFGVTHVLLAAYVRCCHDCPWVNRFLQGQRVYQRDEIIVSMVIKKEMDASSPDTVIKVKFSPEDTAADVYNKFNIQVENTKSTLEMTSNYDHVTEAIRFIPRLILRYGVKLLMLLDYFGWLPNIIHELSPFHGSMFITSMGSLGIPPIFHHLYDFGNIPVFCSFGKKRFANEITSEGEVVRKKYIDYNFVTDERICDGFSYAQVLKTMRSYLLHPNRLDSLELAQNEPNSELNPEANVKADNESCQMPETPDACDAPAACENPETSKVSDISEASVNCQTAESVAPEPVQKEEEETN